MEEITKGAAEGTAAAAALCAGIRGIRRRRRLRTRRLRGSEDGSRRSRPSPRIQPGRRSACRAAVLDGSLARCRACLNWRETSVRISTRRPDLLLWLKLRSRFPAEWAFVPKHMRVVFQGRFQHPYKNAVFREMSRKVQYCSSAAKALDQITLE